MSIRDAVYKELAQDPILKDMLAEKPASLGTGPAIFEYWAPPETPMPYVNLGYTATPGAGTIKREYILSVDIFTEGADSTEPEEITRRIVELLDLKILKDPQDGPIRLYLESEGDIPEGRENILHWAITFYCVNWRRGFIRHLESR